MKDQTTPKLTREQWLMALTEELRQSLFSQTSSKLPELIEVSCGWPSTKALTAKSRRIGECWSPESSADGLHEIFISPFLGDALEVAATLTHELVHAAVGVDKKHGSAFKRAMTEVGLEGKATATHAGEDLKMILAAILALLPAYPHTSIDKKQTTVKPQKGRMLKAECPEDGYTVRLTKKWLDVGLPVCPCGKQMESDVLNEDQNIDDE